MKKYFYPNLDKHQIIERGFVLEKSAHSRGSTVDVTLFDMDTAKDVDMGSTFDFFGKISHSSYKDITDEQFKNRMILRKVMLSHGFTPYREEWWHFTLKDEPFSDTYFDFPVNSNYLK